MLVIVADILEQGSFVEYCIQRNIELCILCTAESTAVRIKAYMVLLRFPLSIYHLVSGRHL